MDLTKDFNEFLNNNKPITTPKNDFINPSIIEERDMGVRVTEMNVFSRLMKERIIFLSGQVTSDSMDTIVAQMLYLDSVSHEPINLYINSGGGDCYSGLELVSVMNYIKSPVYTTVLGLAASMGAVIASSGEKGHRYVLPYSRFMIHQPSSQLPYSTFKDTEIHLKEMDSVKKDLYEILANNCGKTVEEIEQLCDRDNWYKSKEIIDMGFADNIIQ